jgi:hypothetical protein
MMNVFEPKKTLLAERGSPVAVLALLGCLALAGLCFTTGCSDPPNLREEIVGVYKETLPAGHGLERVYTLELRPDSSCSFSRQYVKKGTVAEKGTWTNEGRIVTIALVQRHTNMPLDVIQFKWRGAKLTSSKWDLDLYGSEGLGTLIKEKTPGTNAPVR